MILIEFTPQCLVFKFRFVAFFQKFCLLVFNVLFKNGLDLKGVNFFIIDDLIGNESFTNDLIKGVWIIRERFNQIRVVRQQFLGVWNSRKHFYQKKANVCVVRERFYQKCVVFSNNLSIITYDLIICVDLIKLHTFANDFDQSRVVTRRISLQWLIKSNIRKIVPLKKLRSLRFTKMKDCRNWFFFNFNILCYKNDTFQELSATKKGVAQRW